MRNSNHFFYPFRKGDEAAPGNSHGLNLHLLGIVSSSRYMDGFHSPFLQLLGDFLSVPEGDPTGDKFAGANPHHQGELFPGHFPAAMDHLFQEAEAAVGIPPVSILPSVGKRRKKLVN